MIITQTDRSTYLDVSKIQWEPTKYPGIFIKTLYKDPSGKHTTLTKMEKGCRLPKHKHVGWQKKKLVYRLKRRLASKPKQRRDSWPRKKLVSGLKQRLVVVLRRKNNDWPN